MNVLSSLLNFIADTIGNVSMGTSATTLKGAIAETYARTRNVYAKGTYSSEQTLYGVSGFTGPSGNVYLNVPISLASDVGSNGGSISFTELKCSIRTVSGTYLGGSGGVDLKEDIVSTTIVPKQPLVQIRLQNSNYGVTAHTPLTGQIVAKFTLS